MAKLSKKLRKLFSFKGFKNILGLFAQILGILGAMITVLTFLLSHGFMKDSDLSKLFKVVVTFVTGAKFKPDFPAGPGTSGSHRKPPIIILLPPTNREVADELVKQDSSKKEDTIKIVQHIDLPNRKKQYLYQSQAIAKRKLLCKLRELTAVPIPERPPQEWTDADALLTQGDAYCRFYKFQLAHDCYTRGHDMLYTLFMKTHTIYDLGDSPTQQE